MVLIEYDLPTKGVVVEVGCGPVSDLPGLLAGLGTADAIGIDIDEQALREVLSPSLTAVCADVGHLPLRPRSVSAILMRAVLHHVVDIDACLAECADSLEVGGRIIIEDGVALEPDDAGQMNDELRAAGLTAETHPGLDVALLQRSITSVGLHVRSLRVAGVATFATPPHVSKLYTSDRFVLTAQLQPRT